MKTRKMLKSGDTLLPLPFKYHEEVKMKIPYKRESEFQERPKQIVSGIFETVTVNRDGTIKWGFKLLDVLELKRTDEETVEHYYNDYLALSTKELSGFII